MDRRTSLRWMLAAAAAPLGLSSGLPVAAAGLIAGYGTDPNLVRSYRAGELWPLTFSEAQRALATALCRLILPADAQSPGAADVGVPVFIDEWVSAPYPTHVKDRATILAGFAWLDAQAQARFGRPFAAADDAQQRQICDEIRLARGVADALKEPAAFFARFRDLTAGGFYTTPAGAKDLGFVGNVPSQHFDGPPDAVLKQVGIDMNELPPHEAAQGWQRLFDGRTLDGWRASDAPGSFSVKDGAIVVRGPRSHLFYLGPDGNASFRDFELKLEVMTFPNANSGVYFHTEWQAVGWPAKGYEVQVNNSHSDTSRSAGLWGIVDFREVLVPDGRWFTLGIRVQGQRIVTTIDGRTVVDHLEERGAARPKGLEQRWLSRGTFALQGHDPGSEVHYRNIRVRALDT